MPKYRLLSGLHDDGKRLYEPGDIVESDIDLPGRFANKFERVYPADDTADTSPEVEDHDSPEPELAGVPQGKAAARRGR